TFASVIIGSGKGNLSKRQAVRGMLEGLRDALNRLPEKSGIVKVKKLILIEHSKEYYKLILDILHEFKSDKKVSDMDLKITQTKMKRSMTRWKDRPEDIPEQALPGTRITIERNRDIFVFSALQESAVIPAREVEVQSFFASGAAERLMQSSMLKEQEQYGQLLNTYLIPEDFHQLITDSETLTLILDRSTAAFPWEMACFRSAMGLRFFGPDLKLTRQFRTMLSSAPGIIPHRKGALKALIIADPCLEPELQLPGARREGREVVKVLNRYKKDLDITVVDRIGAVECDPVEILALMLNEDFDIVHFAGHGVFDEKDPHHSGWVFGRDRILSAREIFRARRVSTFVFANACFSAVIKERQATNADEMNRRLAGLAEAFFERGIQNYIGAGWPVDDDPAVAFASVFYENALSGEMLGESLSMARKRIMGLGSTWGAYQHYGQVNARLVTK
ncbi:MAG: CHAT domain-containing protein, partial [Nitrospiraceae bacterium]